VPAHPDTDIASYRHPHRCQCTACHLDRHEAAVERRGQQERAEWWAAEARVSRERREARRQRAA
jgi:hypothetical protein